jgi:hypothetical protein
MRNEKSRPRGVSPRSGPVAPACRLRSAAAPRTGDGRTEAVAAAAYRPR